MFSDGLNEALSLRKSILDVQKAHRESKPFTKVKEISKCDILELHWFQTSVTNILDWQHTTCSPLVMEHSMEIQYSQFFSARCDGRAPYFWQRKLGEDSEIRNRLISIPTGFGKTLGVAFAWIYQRVVRQNPSWPRRLVWCLPMRTLVEQTAEILSNVTKDLSLSVNILMGGSDAGNYHLEPEKDAIFVGTQDMLISRALNRGYGTARARWPMEFALLNNDCLWVFDEIQLMDVSLITSVQMQQFRNEDYAKTSGPVKFFV